MKTAAAYIRVSDDRQDEFSPDSQIKLIREYCKKNNIELPEELIFYDDGISAKTAEKRVKFNEMIALAKLKDRPFDMILVWKFSRFARNQEESIVYKSLLRKNGVEVISISEPLSDNPFGGLIERIIEWMDEYYLIRLSDEVRRGMTERATRGLPNVAPPYGYEMKNGNYVIIPAQAEIVRKIFQMYVDGYKIRKIAEDLNNLGIKNKFNNPFDNRGIDYILNNPTYIGYHRWNPNGRSSSARKFNNPEDILEKGTHEPIIDEILYRKAQELNKMRYQTRQKYMRDTTQNYMYSLKGLIKCDTCGATLVYSKANNGLQCHMYAKGKCKVSHFISLPKVEKLVINALKEAAANLNFKIEAQDQKVTTEYLDYEKLIKRQQLKLERAKEAYQEGADSLAEYKANKTKIIAKIKEYEEEKEKILHKVKKPDNIDYQKTVLDAIKIIEDPEASTELKNQILKTILKKVVYISSTKEIELYFNL